MTRKSMSDQALREQQLQAQAAQLAALIGAAAYELSLQRVGPSGARRQREIQAQLAAILQ